jgi:hypothetical protein
MNSLKKKDAAFLIQCEIWSPQFQFVLSNKIEIYFVKSSINSMSRCFLTPQELIAN